MNHIAKRNHEPEKIEYAIEQHPSFLKVIPAEELEELEQLNKLRQWEIE